MDGQDPAPSVLVCTWRDRTHPDAGGAEVYLDHVVRALADAGWRVTVATAGHPGAATDEVVDGVRTVRFGGTFDVYARVAWAYLRGRLGRPDVVVDVQNGVSFLASVWSRRPVVVLHHHAHREQWRALFGEVLGRIGWFVESQVLPRLQRRATYVTVSGASRDDLVAQGVDPTRVAVVHNGVTPPTAVVPDEAAEPRLVVLGRLVPHKRVELAIDAVARLRAEFPDLHLDVVGDGAWRDQLVAHARRRGVTEAVTFHGQVDDATRTTLLGRAWALVLPSVKEGWGLVVVEAALARTPSVAFTAAGGVRESVLDEETGLLVGGAGHGDDAEAVAGLVEALRRLLGDEALRRRLGTAAAVRARTLTWAGTGTRFVATVERARRG